MSLAKITQAKSNEILFVGSNFPAILQQSNQGEVSGLAADIIDHIMSSLNMPYKIIIVPWKRAQTMIEHGQADVIIGPYKTAKREALFDFSTHPFYKDKMVLYAHRSNTIQWTGNLSTLQGKTLGVPLGWTGGENYESSKHLINIYHVPGLKNGIQMLIKKRVDFVLGNLRNAEFIISQHKIGEDLRLLLPEIQSTNGYFGFSKNATNPSFKTQFSEELSKLLSQGEIKRMNHKYGLSFDESSF
ncbi:MAG: transporter substrate-binding domain-containing protein [Paraglaciecola sp.]|uniref:substrate-binding periplasmic protein n=1 Tax=Paraglaciecola sp. TaxID=1920173 RepID=UPI00329A48D5